MSGGIANGLARSLYAELERLESIDLDGDDAIEKLKAEVNRAKAISTVAAEISKNNHTILKVCKLRAECTPVPPNLLGA